MIGLLAAAVLVASGAGVCSSPEVFAAKFQDRAARAYPDLSFKANGELAFLVRRGETDVGSVFLDSRHAMCSADPDAEDSILDAYVASVGPTLADAASARTPEERRAHMVVVLRPVEYARALIQQGAAVAQRPFVGGVARYLAEKREDTLSFVAAEHVVGLAASADEAWTLAERNIPAKVTGVQVEHLGRKVFLVMAETQDAPSLILLESFWAEHGRKVRGRPTVYLADREQFLFTGDEERDGLQALSNIRSRDDGTALTSEFYVRTGEGWIVAPE